MNRIIWGRFFHEIPFMTDEKQYSSVEGTLICPCENKKKWACLQLITYTFLQGEITGFLFYLFYYPLSFCKIPKPVFLDTPSMLEVSIRGSSIGIPTRCTEAQLKNQVDSREQTQSSIFSHFFSLKSMNVLNLAISVFTSSSLWSLTLALVCSVCGC